MEKEKAQELTEHWGNKPCEHPSFEEEFHLRSTTGDYVCTKRGLSATKEYFEQQKTLRKS